MSKADIQFIETVMSILNDGVWDTDRQVRARWKDGTPAHAISKFGVVNRYDLSKEFPITTLRPTAWKNSLKEILWVYQDKSNSVQLLKDKYDIHWWDSWTDDNLTIKKGYGYQVSKVHKYSDGNFDMIDRLIYDLKTNPHRRMIINLFNHEDLNEMTLAPCAFMTMFNVQGKKLNMTLVQRSSDYLLAGNINAVQYALLQHMIAQATGYEVGEFIHFINDCHVYIRNLKQASEIISRESLPAPKLIIDKSVNNFYDFKVEHFELENYLTHGQLKFEVAI